MRKIEKRGIFCLILAALLGIGLALFCFRFVVDGGDWASYPYNRHLYNNEGVLKGGTVLDRDGDVLSTLDENGNRVENGGAISFGQDNDYTVTYETEGGSTTITNTFKEPAKYLWVVNAHYTHYDYNGNVIDSYNTLSEISLRDQQPARFRRPGRLCGQQRSDLCL